MTWTVSVTETPSSVTVTPSEIETVSVPTTSAISVTVSGDAVVIGGDLPNGGTANQALIKQSSVDGDADWQDLAADITDYTNDAYPSIETVQDALDSLLFFTMTASLSGGSNAEYGGSISAVDLVWSYNKTITAQEITGTGSSTPLLADRAQTVTGPFTTNHTWTITGHNGAESPVGSTSLTFLSKRYWGVSSDENLDDADVIGDLNDELSTSLVQSRTLTPSGQYLYFAWPTSFGVPSFTVNGLLSTAWSKVRDTSLFVNASGGIVDYDVWRSDNLLTSTYSVDVAAGTTTWIAVSESHPVFGGITWDKHLPARSACLRRNASDANHYRFEVAPGDECVSIDGSGSGKERCEFSAGNYPFAFETAYTVTYQIKVYTPGVKDVASAGWVVIGQIHATPDIGDAGVSPLYAREIYVSPRAIAYNQRQSEVDPIVSNPSSNYLYNDSGAEWSEWIDVVEEHFFSPSTTNGYHRVYHNGVLIANYSGKTGYVDAVGPYYKFGIYRAADATHTLVVEYKDFDVTPAL